MTLSDNARGALLLSTAMTIFVANDAAMKLAAQGIPMIQALALRGMAATALFGLVAWRMGALADLSLVRDPKTLLRTAAEVVGSMLFMLSLAHIPLATAAALNQAVPLLSIPLAMLLLGEKVGWRRIAALFAGFAGVLMILRPSPAGIDPWLLASFASAWVFALRDCITRMLSSRIPTILITLLMSASMTVVGALGTVAIGWTPMAPDSWWLLAIATVAVALGYTLQVAAFRLGELSLVGGFRYSGLIGSAFAGWLLWGYLPDALTWTGMALIVGSGLYALHRSRVRAKGV
jgi:drug/metabolite transporter (DMT)-like permease